MKRTATLLTLAFFAAGAAQAQPARTNNGALTDQIFARDVGDATITLDGTLSESEWDAAESIELQYDGTGFIPGGGYETLGGPFALDAPTDGVDGTLRLLRKGNTIYVGLTVRDKSIGGSRDFFQHDGLVMTMQDHRRRDDFFARSDTSFVPNYGNYSNDIGILYSWLNRGVGSLEAGQDTVGQAPTVDGSGILDRRGPDERIDSDVFAFSYTIDGVANDDFNGNATKTDDVGYVMELSINAETLGFDLDSGDALPITFGLYDLDYAWPADPDLQYRTRAWFQNPWEGNFPWGIGYVVGRPDVTVSSGALPNTEPDLRIGRTAGITLDGQLTEGAWGGEAPVSLQYQMSEDELDELPGAGPLNTHWFRPGSDEAVPVIDRSTGDFRFTHDGNTLYVALDSDDAAISGNATSEARYDGFRLTVRDLTPEAMRVEESRYEALEFTVVVDSSGTARLLQDAANNDGVQAAAFLKGSSTAANPNDVDEGYSIEMSIDLTQVGVDMSEGLIWIGANYFDGDVLDPDANSYGTRTWWLTERGGGGPGPSARAFLDNTFNTPTEGGVGADGFRSLGNAPNPFRALTAVRYELPRAATVTVEVFDVLGRLVRTVDAGLQAAGPQATDIDAAGLSTGSYVYRVRLDDGATVTGQMLVVR